MRLEFRTVLLALRSHLSRPFQPVSLSLADCPKKRDRRKAIDRARNNYNIKLVLAEASGSYVSDVTLHITTVLGDPVISIPSAGPLVLLQLPPGTYLINAAYEGRNAQKRFDVSDNLAQTVNVLW